MPIIDYSSKTDRFLNNAAPQLQGALGGLVNLAFVQQQREDRQREERNRLNLADRDFAFRQQQAGLQQQNTDRVFEQRQQLIDRQMGQEDAAADYYRGKLQELYPGPVGGMDFAGMDAQTLRGVYNTELDARDLEQSRRSAQVVWEQILGEFGVDLASPEAAQVQAMLDGADTKQDVEKAKGMAYQIAGQAREQQFETQRRTMGIEQSKAMRVDVKNPRQMAALSVLDQQYLNGDLDSRQWWSAMGDVINGDFGGGGQRPTVERVAFGRGMDAAMGAFGAGSVSLSTREETEERIRMMAEMTGQPLPAGIKPRSAQASASPTLGGITPTALRMAASEVAKKSDRQQQLLVAHRQAQKIARESGLDPSDEAVLAEIMRRIVPAASGTSSTGLQGNM